MPNSSVQFTPDGKTVTIAKGETLLKAAELAGVFVAEELGDLLFATVNLARFEKFDPEDLLNQAVDKFVKRFQQIERVVHTRGQRLEDCSLAELDALWEAAKRKTKRRRCVA